MLEFKNQLPFIENTSLQDVIKVCETPFYMYSQDKIIQKVEMTKKVLGENIFLNLDDSGLNITTSFSEATKILFLKF